MERTETVHYNYRKTIDGDKGTLGLSQDKSKVNTPRSGNRSEAVDASCPPTLMEAPSIRGRRTLSLGRLSLEEVAEIRCFIARQ